MEHPKCCIRYFNYLGETIKQCPTLHPIRECWDVKLVWSVNHKQWCARAHCDGHKNIYHCRTIHESWQAGMVHLLTDNDSKLTADSINCFLTSNWQWNETFGIYGVSKGSRHFSASERAQKSTQLSGFAKYLAKHKIKKIWNNSATMTVSDIRSLTFDF
jgi:hypothetical protein